LVSGYNFKTSWASRRRREERSRRLILNLKAWIKDLLGKEERGRREGDPINQERGLILSDYKMIGY